MENKRTYIRRKRCLNEITAMIKNALQYISERKNNEMSEEMIDQIAHSRSSEIEAACWFPKQHMTETEYASLLMGKAKLLCQALINSKIPQAGNAGAMVPPVGVQPIVAGPIAPRAPTPIPKIPTMIPVIKQTPKIPSVQPPLISQPYPDRKLDLSLPPEKNPFYGTVPMNREELNKFLESASFSFSSINENTLPPLVDRKLNNRLL